MSAGYVIRDILDDFTARAESPALLPDTAKHGFDVLSSRTTRIVTQRSGRTRIDLFRTFACRFTDSIEQY
jgi:hypothetical protein